MCTLHRQEGEDGRLWQSHIYLSLTLVYMYLEVKLDYIQEASYSVLWPKRKYRKVMLTPLPLAVATFQFLIFNSSERKTERNKETRKKEPNKQAYKQTNKQRKNQRKRETMKERKK